VTAATLTMLAVDLVDASPDQNREHFDERELGELAASIRELGLLQPVTVRPATDRYVLAAGERRLRAVKLLGWAEIPAIVRGFARETGRRADTDHGDDVARAVAYSR